MPINGQRVREAQYVKRRKRGIQMETFFCSGNEAIGRGAIKAGIKIACGYPGAPITPALEYLINSQVVDAQWSVNEKVAFDTALGVSICGQRSLAVMKTLGLNVAADALTQSAGGFLNGGMVVAVADDTGRDEGDDDQDSRFYGVMSGIPVLEPGSCQEAYDFTRWGFEISEAFGIPVLIRMNSVTTRIKESVTDSTIDFSVAGTMQKQSAGELFFGQKTILNIIRFGFIEKNSRLRKYDIDFRERFQKLKSFSENLPLNEVIPGNGRIGFITSGILYQYCREYFPDAGYLKLGMIHPLPEKLISEFIQGYEHVFVVEEIYPIIENAIKALKFTNIIGREIFCSAPQHLHMTPELIYERVDGYINKKPVKHEETPEIPVRLPQNCPGCPHLFTYEILKRMGVSVVSGIGCCGLSALPIMNASNVVQSMGSPPSIIQGFYKAQGKEQNLQAVAVFGDGEFWHSGILGILDAVYNGNKIKVVILENNVIGMTGGQSHPSTVTKGEKPRLSIKNMCKAIGVESVNEIDPYNYRSYTNLLKRELASDKSSVIIAKRKCPRIYQKVKPGFCYITSNCVRCGKCMLSGCAAVSKKSENGAANYFINPQLCVGCRLCQNICPKKAIAFRGVRLHG
jgi:indolepyruvate ferredoxin oxidoreductase alpha subunit